MDYHHHARLTIYSREQLAREVLERRRKLGEVAVEYGLSRQTAGKWVRRFREQDKAGLADRCSRPHRSPRCTSAELVAQVEGLRSEADYSKLLDRFGIRRTDPRFWAVSDQVSADYQNAEAISHGVLDYSRYENR